MTGHLQNLPLADFIRRKLASTASDFITGAAIPVEGGYSVADRLLYD